MSYIKFENRKYELTNEIPAEKVRIDKFGSLVQVYGLSAYMTATSFEAFLEILTKVDYKVFTTDFAASLAKPILKLERENESRIGRSFYHNPAEFEHCVFMIMIEKNKEKKAEKNREVDAATTLATAVAQAEEKLLNENEANLAEALKHIGNPEPENKKVYAFKVKNNSEFGDN